MRELKWVLQAYCTKHGILTKDEDGKAHCPDCGGEPQGYPPLEKAIHDAESAVTAGAFLANTRPSASPVAGSVRRWVMDHACHALSSMHEHTCNVGKGAGD